jgi:hypothetical protein
MLPTNMRNICLVLRQMLHDDLCRLRCRQTDNYLSFDMIR